MTKVQIMSEKGKQIAEKNNAKTLTTNDLANDFIKNQGSPILTNLLKYHQQVLEVAAKEVIRRPALLSRYDAKNGEIVPIISQGTINLLQGKQGSHKSRLSELFTCLFLMNKATCDTDFLEFMGANFPVAVVYFDTERGLKDEFPLVVQRIREKAGYDKTYPINNFYPLSIAKVERKDRVTSVGEWLKFVQSQTSLPLFVILDVLTDCVESFNNDKSSLLLFDELRNFADDYDATFLLVIHENPASEKARGHTGTEGQNKASTVMQIGYTSDDDNLDLIKIRFLKTRNCAKPNPIFLQYSKEAHGLVLADTEAVRQQTEDKRKAFDLDLVKEHLENFLTIPKEVNEIYDDLAKEFKKQVQTVKYKVAELIDQKHIFHDAEGRECVLTREKDTKDKRRVLLTLSPLSIENQTEISFAEPEN